MTNSDSVGLKKYGVFFIASLAAAAKPYGTVKKFPKK
jgi:hypothetical protein